MKKSTMTYLVAVSFITMFVMAISSALRGVLVPTFKEAFNVNNSEVGLMISMTMLFSMIFTYIGSNLCEKYGSKKIIILGVSISAVAFFATSFATTFMMLSIGHFVTGAGSALLIIGLNTTVPYIPVSVKSLLMNMLHFFYGLGVMISQKVSGYLLVNSYTWQFLFRVCSVLFVINIILLLFIADVGEKSSVKVKSNRTKKETRLIILITLALGFAVSGEIHTGNWFINYMKEIFLYDENKATYFTALFFGMFSASRFLGGFISEKLGYIRTITYSVLFATVTYIIGYVVGEPGLVLISSSGLFIGLLYPTTLVYTSNLFKEKSSSVIGLITTAASFIAFATGIILGYLNDFIGVKASYALMPLFLLISTILYIYIYRLKPENN